MTSEPITPSEAYDLLVTEPLSQRGLDALQALIDGYKALVGSHNALIDGYNVLIDGYKALVDNHNALVGGYNALVAAANDAAGSLSSAATRCHKTTAEGRARRSFQRTAERVRSVVDEAVAP